MTTVFRSSSHQHHQKFEVPVVYLRLFYLSPEGAPVVRFNLSWRDIFVILLTPGAHVLPLSPPWKRPCPADPRLHTWIRRERPCDAAILDWAAAGSGGGD